MIVELNARSREVFKHIVDAYTASGVPVGSRTISRRLQEQLSPATIRNVMSDLEELGLLFAPHTSAGRMPTEAGLRLYVDGLLEFGGVATDEREKIESHCAGVGKSMENVLSDALEMLSGLSQYAGIVMAPTTERAFRHVEFVPLGTGRALVVTVNDNGMVENRVIEIPTGMSTSKLVEAGNYLTSRLSGRTLHQARSEIETEINDHQNQLDVLTKRVVEAGLATWSEVSDKEGLLLVRGQAKLLEDVNNLVDLEHIRNLFEALEAKQSFLNLIESAQRGDGVQVYIGAENELFALLGLFGDHRSLPCRARQ